MLLIFSFINKYHLQDRAYQDVLLLKELIHNWNNMLKQVGIILPWL
jgi:hypothetical protein